MKKYTLRKFLTLLAEGATLEQMQKNDVLEKAYQFGPMAGELKKEAAEAVRAIRVENGISEKQVMDALGLSDVNEYLQWESGNATIELTAENMTALAKVLKIDVPTLAAKMVSADGPDPKIDDTTGSSGNPDSGSTNGAAGGDQTTPPGTAAPAKSTTAPTADQIAKQKHAAGSSAARIVHIGNSTTVDKSDVEKTARLNRELRKSILGVSDKALQKGSILAEDFAPSSVLDPELSNQLVNLLVDQSEFLKRIQVRPMARQKQEVLVWDITSRKAARALPGWPSVSDMQKGINKAKLLTAEKMTLMWQIENRTLMNYQNNLAGLEAEIVNGFTGALRNDIMDLGFNGLTSNWDSIYNAGGAPAFTDLNIGYQQLATANSNPAQVLNGTTLDTLYSNGNHSTGTFVPQKAFDAMIAAGFATNPRFFDDTTPIICGVSDWATHESNLLLRNDATPVLINGVESKYRGRPVSQINYLATKNMIQTKLENFILGIVTGTQGSDGIVIERHVIPQAVLFVATIYLDFDYVNYDAVLSVHA